MAEITRFGGLVDFYIQSLQTALGRTLLQRGPQQAASLQLLKKTMKQGPHQSTKLVLETLTLQGDVSPDKFKPLVASILKLAELTPELLKKSVRADTLEKSLDETYILGLLVEDIGQADMAYNLFETSYHLATVLQKPCLPVTEKLRQLSNTNNVDQHRAAIWRFGTEKLRSCIIEFKTNAATPALPRPANTDWLVALDAVELALTVYAVNPTLQQQLCDQFVFVLRQAEATPIEDLIAIYPTQVDRRYVAPEMRRKMIEALTGRKFEASDPPSRIAALERWATVKGQTMLDDVRLKLSQRYHGRPNLSWHDRTLQHENLLHAVPLGQSLVADIDRTGVLVLELTHEVAHAHCLLGPIGWAITAFRVAAHCCETILESADTPEDNVDKRADGLAHLSENPALLQLAEVQLASCYRSAVHEAIWTPWLEGVAQYVEMLADPKKDPQEIMAVHEATRSLIDFRCAPLPGETEEVFSCRYGEESAKQFEDFFSDALSRYSRLRQINYLEAKAGREVYLFGYLLVRSIVARWELTIGRRIEPVWAAKLLLNATRNGTQGLDFGLCVDPEDFCAHATAVFQQWIDTIAKIDQEALETFFENVPSDSRGHTYYWRGGIPCRIAKHIDGALSEVDSNRMAFQAACSELVAGDGLREGLDGFDFAAKVAAESQSTISDLFLHYLETASLLPVGKDMARLLLLDNGNAMATVRTYLGLDDQTDDGSMPRYSIRFFPLGGGVEEAGAIRLAFELLGTARLLVTRVVDLVGHPSSPMKRPNVSYVCLFLGDEWHHVTLGDSFEAKGADANFSGILRRRVLHPPFPNEATTLRSPTALAQRLMRTKKDSRFADMALRLNKDSLSLAIALKTVARGLGSTDSEMQDLTASTLSGARSRIDLADYLSLTGRGIQTNGNHPALSAPLASLAFTRQSMSGVRAFGVSYA
jgi:hypothetical protein